MSKDLPYFKFIVNEWITGDITLEDFETQGLFINLCAYYWSKEASVSLSNCKRKFSQCKPTAFDSLVSAGVIKVDVNGMVKINFLDEQILEREYLSKTNSKNGKLGGRPHKKPTALKSESESKPKKSNIEEKREEEKREDIKQKSLNDLIEDFKIANPMKYSDVMLADFLRYWQEKNPKGKMRYQAEDFFELPRRLATWYKNSTKNNFSQKANGQGKLVL